MIPSGGIDTRVEGWVTITNIEDWVIIDCTRWGYGKIIVAECDGIHNFEAGGMSSILS